MELQPGQDGYAKAFIAELKSRIKQGKKMTTVDEIKAKYGTKQNDAVTVFGEANGGSDYQSLLKTYGYKKNAGVMENKSVLFALNKRIETAKMMIRDYKALIANLEKVRKTHP